MRNTLNTESLGIFQPDIILRTALVKAIADMRANPWLLDYAFASLPVDSLTAGEYGDLEVARAKEWFQKTDISVVFTMTTNDPKFPCVSIQLVASQEIEQESTLGDTHYQPFEDNNWDWPVLVGPITPLKYDYKTGTITLDPTFIDIVLAPGMNVVTTAGHVYPIATVTDIATLTIAPGTVDNFDGMVIKTANPAYITELESAIFRESYALGCHVDSEPVHLIYLHTLIVFILKRYNQALLEGRGFERSTISSADLKRNDDDVPEFLFSRYIQITGAVRQYWPKTVTMKGEAVLVVPQATEVNTPTNVAPALPTDIDALLNSDPLSFVGKP